MSLKSINPTETKSWSKLKDHFNNIKETHINDYFTSNNDRANQLSITFDNFHFDFSKNKINSETISLFNDLLTEIDLKSIQTIFIEEDNVLNHFLNQLLAEITKGSREKRFLMW